LFATGHDYWGLFVAGLMAMVDYVDGEVARFDGGGSALGAHLDTSLDYLYLMLLIGTLGWSHHCMIWAYSALVTITFSNWVQYNGGGKYTLPFFMQTVFILPLTILLKEVGIGLGIITAYQLTRTVILYERSIECWRNSASLR
jgi:phosphatidylglycerophosphate synthase